MLILGLVLFLCNVSKQVACWLMLPNFVECIEYISVVDLRETVFICSLFDVHISTN